MKIFQRQRVYVVARREVRFLRLTHRRTQNAVDELRRAEPAKFFRKLHRLVDRRRVRHSVQKKYLIEADAQDGQNFFVDFVYRAVEIF